VIRNTFLRPSTVVTDAPSSTFDLFGAEEWTGVRKIILPRGKQDPI